jgi:hypothetical protein
MMKRIGVLALTLFCLPIIACIGEYQMGALPSDATPHTFELQGESDHIWKLDAKANTRYEIEVVARSILSGGHIVIHAIDEDYQFIETPMPPPQLGVDRIIFRAPAEDQQMTIKVYSLIGELGTSQGDYTIRARELGE